MIAATSLKRPSDWIIHGLVAVISGLSFLSCLRFGFLQWDDYANIVTDPHLNVWSLESLRWMFTTRFQGPYQPLSWLSLSLDAHLWGLQAGYWHATNLFIHVVNGVLFFTLLERLGLKAAAAATGALLWSVHPLRTESVVWITERRDVLSGFFVLLSLHAYKSRRLGATWSAFLAALLSKATAVGLVWGLIGMDLLPNGRLPRDPRLWSESTYRKVWLEKLPFIGLALIFGMVNLVGYHNLGLLQTRYDFADRLVLCLSNTSFYFQKILWPYPLLPYYELPVHLADMAGFLCVHGLFTVLLSAILLFNYRRISGITLAWVCFGLILAPMSGLAQNGQQMAADRYTYLAALPLSVLVGFGLKRWPVWEGPAAIAIVLVSILSFRQTAVWRDDNSLWQHTLRHEPDTYIAHSNLATLAMREGRQSEAEAHFEAAIRLLPRDVESRLNWGSLLEQRGQFAQAEKLYRQALEIRPGDGMLLCNLAIVRADQGDFKDALRNLREVVQRQPELAEAQFNLGMVLLHEGKRLEGYAHLRQAIRLKPSLAQRLKSSPRS